MQMNSFWSNLACLRPLLLRRRPTKWRQQRRNGRRGLPSFGVPGFFFLALPFFGFVLGGRSAQAYRISTKTTGAELTPFFFTFFAIFCLFSRERKMRREKRTRNLHTHTQKRRRGTCADQRSMCRPFFFNFIFIYWIVSPPFCPAASAV